MVFRERSVIGSTPHLGCGSGVRIARFRLNEDTELMNRSGLASK